MKDWPSIVLLDSPHGPLALLAGEYSAGLERAREQFAMDQTSEQAIPEPNPLLDSEAAGRLLNVPATWLLQRAREGRIPHVRIGKYVRFDVDQIRAEFARESG